MKPAIRNIIANSLSRRSFQPLLYKLNLLTLTGMNYGNANVLQIENSGELDALKYIKKNLSSNNLIFFDVGANGGDYALLIHRLFNTAIKS